MTETNIPKIIPKNKTCTKCGDSLPATSEFFNKCSYVKSGLRSWCKICKNKNSIEWSKQNKEYKKEWYEKNKEQIAKKGKKRYENNKEKIAEEGKKYRVKNKKRIARQNKIYRQKNKEAIFKSRKRYREKNKKLISEKKRIYHQSEAGKTTGIRGTHKRRALKMNAECENFNPLGIFERDNYICQNCGKKTRPDYNNISHPLYPNLDHIIPLSKGGAHTRQNTQCLCRKCNSIKGAGSLNDQMLLFG